MAFRDVGLRVREEDLVVLKRNGLRPREDYLVFHCRWQTRSWQLHDGLGVRTDGVGLDVPRAELGVGCSWQQHGTSDRRSWRRRGCGTWQRSVHGFRKILASHGNIMFGALRITQTRSNACAAVLILSRADTTAVIHGTALGVSMDNTGLVAEQHHIHENCRAAASGA